VSRFLEYCGSGFVSGLTGQLQYVYDRQVRLTWREHVAERVTGRDPEMRQRRSLIATTLLGRSAVTKKEISQLTPELAVACSTCGPKTLSRDLNELLSLELIVEREAGYEAREDVLLNLLPLVVSDVADPLLPPAGKPDRLG